MTLYDLFSILKHISSLIIANCKPVQHYMFLNMNTKKVEKVKTELSLFSSWGAVGKGDTFKNMIAKTRATTDFYSSGGGDIIFFSINLKKRT